MFGVFDGHGGSKASEFAAKNLNRSILKGFSSGICEEKMEDGIRDAYLSTDEEFLKLDVNSGSCCVTAAFMNGNVAVSNLGDCRAVICRGGNAEALTSDHKASREDERDRIEALVSLMIILPIVALIVFKKSSLKCRVPSCFRAGMLMNAVVSGEYKALLLCLDH